MPSYTFTPNETDAGILNRILGTDKITALDFKSPHPALAFKTDTPLTEAELDQFRSKMADIYPLGFTERVEE